MSRSDALSLAVLCTLAISVVAPSAHAETIVGEPGVHPNYLVELEPHFLFQPVEPPGFATGAGVGIGPGFRASFEFLDNGPIPTLNNTMALGFGIDWAHFESGGRCRNIGCEDSFVDHIYFPFVLQWNFWLTDQWSVFGEPGLAYRYSPDTDDRLDTFVIAAGGRFHVAERFALTLRVGYPAFSAGLSFLL